MSQMLCACETFTLIFTYLFYKDVISYIMKVHGVRVFSTVSMSICIRINITLNMNMIIRIRRNISPHISISI